MLNGEFGMLNSAFSIPHSTFLCQAYFQRLRFVSKPRFRKGRKSPVRNVYRLETCNSNPHYLGPPKLLEIPSQRKDPAKFDEPASASSIVKEQANSPPTRDSVLGMGAN